MVRPDASAKRSAGTNHWLPTGAASSGRSCSARAVAAVGRTRGSRPCPATGSSGSGRTRSSTRSVQLTISGCLGPCDLANVLCVISPMGMQWFGGLQEQWQYDLLLDWASASRGAGVLLESPAELNRHRFERFAVGCGSLAEGAGPIVDEGSMATDIPSSVRCERGRRSRPASLPTGLVSGCRPDRRSERGGCCILSFRRPLESIPNRR